jgi:uncharacterized protein YjbI with pentapeptide repeats
VGMVGVVGYDYLARPGWIGVADKKFWDYLDLLIVPAVLAFGVYWLNRRQTERDNQAEAERQRERQATEEARKKRELEIENQRAQDQALQAYLNQMSQLLTDKDRPLRGAQPGDDLSAVARARTLTVLRRLDGSRKGSVVQFLYESKLIYRYHSCLNKSGLIESQRPIVSLEGADLSHAYRETLPHIEKKMNLKRADLSGTDLSHAYLADVDLTEANLKNADLWSGADLYRAILVRANLHGAELIPRTTLRYADLEGADLREAVLDEDYPYARFHSRSGAAFTGPIVFTGAGAPNGLVHIWGKTYFKTGKLEGNSLLQHTQLEGANLKRANLHNAKLTDRQLAECKSLEDATMPDGHEYEEWIRTAHGYDWFRRHKMRLGPDKKKSGEYESWIQTSEGQVWLKAVRENGEASSPS